MYYYSGWVYKILHFIEKIEWRMVDKIIAISKSMAEYVEKESGRKVKITLDPIDPKDFKVEPFKHRGGIVMFHGLLTKNKGIDMILEAAKIMEGINFIIIGDGPDYKRLVTLAPKNVFMPGWIAFDQIKYHLQLADVGIAIRSKNPGNEYVVTSPFLQYCILGKPCVVSKRKVFDDINYPYQFSNVDELVKQLRYCLDNKEVGSKWQKYVLENHNAEKIAEEIWKILNS
uniref:Putative glycosyltransferase n=1 Tax=viral metagenome TaxID=1070528 RepID=A0A6M3KTK0_9ZZZZ